MATDVPSSKVGEPAWEVATLFPNQGHWSAEEYLQLPGPRLVEFCEGRLEVLPMPSEWHQAIALYICLKLREYAASRDAGLALIAPLPVRVAEDRFREPDVIFMLAANRDRRGENFWEGADLVMEVVSDSKPSHDWVTKLAEYAAAGIAEYWIADPRDQSLTVFTLAAGDRVYQQAGRYVGEEPAQSVLLPGFGVRPAAAFERPR